MNPLFLGGSFRGGTLNSHECGCSAFVEVSGCHSRIAARPELDLLDAFPHAEGGGLNGQFLCGGFNHLMGSII